MSITGSVVSSCSSVRSDVSIDSGTLLLKHTYVSNYLGLEKFAIRKSEKLKSDRYFQISSKTLQKNYVLYDEKDVDFIFSKLIELIKDCKRTHSSLPKTDFTCLSRAERRKIWIDVDCLSCKRGDKIVDTRHFKMTKLIELIVTTMENFFNLTIEKGVYMTNGKDTCGLHVFFNTLAYDFATASTAENGLMDALDGAFRRAKIINASVDRGCTQMPLPTAIHSNSTSHTRSYRMVKECGTKWDKVRLDWSDMDVETLKCFSSIAFSRHYSVNVVEPPRFRTPESIAPVAMKRKRDIFATCEDDKNYKRKLLQDDCIETADSTVSNCRIEDDDAELMSDELEDGKTACTDNRKVCFTEDEKPGCDLQTKPTDDTMHTESSPDETDDRNMDYTSDKTASSSVSPAAGCNKEEDGSPRLSDFVTPEEPISQPIISREPVSKATDDDEVSAISKYTESSLLSSFRCPSVKNQRAEQQKRKVKRDENDTEAPPLNVIERLPYACEDDKTSAFTDKQYKASLLCAEEEEAAVSKVRLSNENRGGGNQRIYVVEGSSSNLIREYKLLVQLANVNRAVYQDDISLAREWTDVIISYYDQHLRNPVLLAMFKFVFRDESVGTIFLPWELEGIVTSIVHLMIPFRRSDNIFMDDNKDRTFVEEEFEREARPHKVRLVGALIRVCTQLFNMTTAVFSDLWKIQKANERRDMSSLNRTVVNYRVTAETFAKRCFRPASHYDDDLDCSASMFDGEGVDGVENGDGCTDYNSVTNNYTLLASLIVHEEKNLSDMTLYALLYYYHSFPFGAIDRIMEEVHHDALMVTAVIRYFLMYDHRNGKTLTLQEIFEGFNDCAISLKGPEGFIKMRRKSKKRSTTKKGGVVKKSNAVAVSVPKNKDPEWRRRKRKIDDDDYSGEVSEIAMKKGKEDDGDCGDVTSEEVNQLLGGAGRRRKMCTGNDVGPASEITYEFKDKHMWEAVINYYLRPVSIYDDRMVFANDNYDTLEDDAIESSVAHLATSNKNTKGDVQAAFKDARTAWRMPHGSQLIYESDLRSDRLGCCFHINAALKMYEMFCGGCVTRMKRVHKNYLIDRTRFNMTVYDVVAECRTAAVNLTSAIDRSYVNLLLRQPIVPPFLEEKEEIRRLYMSKDEMERGSFCCLSIMDYIRMLNLFERSNYKCKSELETCDYVDKFLNDLYTNEIAAEHPPNLAANAKIRLLYAFYSLFLFEVVFNMRHVYAKRENLVVSIERLCNELDVGELIVLFFGESSMKHVKGLNDSLEHRICAFADDWSSFGKRPSGENEPVGSTAGGRFDVRPVLAAEIPDKMLRMKTLFGQFGFDVMQDCRVTMEDDASTAVGRNDLDPADNNGSAGFTSDESLSGGDGDRVWDDDTKFEQEFYADENWLNAVCDRMLDKRIVGRSHKRPTPLLLRGGGENMFARETLRTIMRLEIKRHIDNDRLGKLIEASTMGNDHLPSAFENTMAAAKYLPMRLKLVALILTTHTVKSKTTSLCPDVVESMYREADGQFADESRTYEGEINTGTSALVSNRRDPPEKVWCRRSGEILSNDRLSLLLHTRWLSEQRFESNFFVGLDPVQVYSVLYEYMKGNVDRYPSFGEFDRTEGEAARNLCTAVMFLLIMSAYDQEHVDLYLKVFLSVEWPGQWAKTIFVWKSNSNAGKSYLFDAIVKRACANSTCINDPKGGKENAPEKAEYVRNFVLFANEFSQANSNELKKIVSESTFKFRMNYGNVMNEAYATGKIMFNCNTLPPTSDEAAINRLTLFDIPFWFCKRQKISDAMLNWIRGPSVSAARWEIAYRHELPSLLTAGEKAFLKSNSDTKDEIDLFDEDTAVRQNILPLEYNKTTSSLFLVQNKTSRLYVSSSPPTDRIVHGLVNITTHFSWLRFFKRLDMPVDFTTLPASSEAVRSEWLSLTLPYQEWKQITGARTDTNRVPAESVYRSLQAFATKKNINYFGIRQFFETDFASSREAIKDEYYIWFDSKAFRD